MSSHTAETPTWQQAELLADLVVCLECFNLLGRFEGKEHRCRCIPRDDEWREQEWGRRDIPALVDLCHLCARNTMKSGTRWSWYACDTCLEVNRSVGTVLGSPRAGALPLGRHSIMNGVTLGGGNIDDAAVRGFSELLRGLTSVWKRIFEWAPEEAGRLAAAADWGDRESVPLDCPVVDDHTRFGRSLAMGGASAGFGPVASARGSCSAASSISSPIMGGIEKEVRWSGCPVLV